MTNEMIVSAMNELKENKSRQIVEIELQKEIERLRNKQETTISKEYSEIAYSLNDIDKSTLRMYKQIIWKPDDIIKLYEEDEYIEKKKDIIPWSKEDFEKNKEIIDKIYS